MGYDSVQIVLQESKVIESLIVAQYWQNEETNVGRLEAQEK